METPETPKPSRKIRLSSIPDDAIVDVKMSGSYVKSVQTILLSMAETMGKEATIKILAKLNEGKPPESLEEATIHILVALVDTAELAAKEQNKIKIDEYTEEDVKKIIEDLDS